MNTLMLIAAFSIAAVSAAEARLGETLEQCRDRYGELLQVPPDKNWPHYPQHIFQKGDVEIRVRFLEGKSAQEIFLIHGRAHLLTDDQISEILAGNTEGSSWHIDPAGEQKDGMMAQRRYVRADGGAIANYVKVFGVVPGRDEGSVDTLQITTPAIESAMSEKGRGF